MGRKCRYDQNQTCNSDFCQLRQSLVSSVVISIGWRAADGDKIMKARISRKFAKLVGKTASARDVAVIETNIYH